MDRCIDDIFSPRTCRKLALFTKAISAACATVARLLRGRCRLLDVLCLAPLFVTLLFQLFVHEAEAYCGGLRCGYGGLKLVVEAAAAEVEATATEVWAEYAEDHGPLPGLSNLAVTDVAP